MLGIKTVFNVRPQTNQDRGSQEKEIDIARNRDEEKSETKEEE